VIVAWVLHRSSATSGEGNSSTPAGPCIPAFNCDAGTPVRGSVVEQKSYNDSVGRVVGMRPIEACGRRAKVAPERLKLHPPPAVPGEWMPPVPDDARFVLGHSVTLHDGSVI